MFLHPRSKDRDFSLGTYPLETLPRDDAILAAERDRPRREAPEDAAGSAPLAAATLRYRDIYAGAAEQEPAPARAPVPDDLQARARDVKGMALFMDAAMVGICEMVPNAWLEGAEPLPHSHAVILLIADGKLPESHNIAHGWVAPAVRETSDMRAAEIALCIARHIRSMGFAARADVAGHRRTEAERLAVMAGLAVRSNGEIVNPYLGTGFSLAVVTTEYALATDRPLAASARNGRGLRYWLGQNGATSGRERNRRARRPSHYSDYPMEQVKRVDRPTTLILDDEVPRVPKRAAFFERALQGDLGAKSQKERSRFSFKHPTSQSLVGAIRSLVPHQDGAPAPADLESLDDPDANARAVKALSYHLGSDLTGICEIPRYAWFSHKEDGRPIEPYHKYAVVMLIDQGFDTMEGASGDDWISGTQSMRAYMRGAEIAGVMAELLRNRGFPARSQTNADSDVLHIPVILWAGLGEMSRIGELVLNPFVGPRFKSVVLTTDMPLTPDKPIDFGLQYFCNNCLKCARECPCDAIPFGDKVMFNGYEIWKPDAERCTRYRLTNNKGAACGRCMKTCPINKVIDTDGPILTRMASWMGVNAMFLKPLMVPIATWADDWLGNGTRNPVKKWWFDHEIIDGVAVEPRVGTNRRDIDPARVVDPAKQRMAYYHADMMPPPDVAGTAHPVDRKAALAAAALLETPAGAWERKQRGEPAPSHYAATPPAGVKGGKTAVNPYAAPKINPVVADISEAAE